MLAYLDRSPCELPLPARLGLMAMRLWAGEVRRNRRPIDLLQGLFENWGTPGALWPAHSFLYWTASHTLRPISLGCPCCGRVSDDEAMILSALFPREEEAACAAMSELVTPDAVTGAARLAQLWRAELAALCERPPN